MRVLSRPMSPAWHSVALSRGMTLHSVTAVLPRCCAAGSALYSRGCRACHRFEVRQLLECSAGSLMDDRRAQVSKDGACMQLAPPGSDRHVCRDRIDQHTDAANPFVFRFRCIPGLGGPKALSALVRSRFVNTCVSYPRIQRG